MSFINPRHQRLKLFLNEPLLRKGIMLLTFIYPQDEFTPKKFEPKEAILHITEPTFERYRNKIRKISSQCQR
jgi:hypothetical protein